MSDVPNTSGAVFGPRPARAELPNPLGKMIRLRIDLEGCKGLPRAKALSESSDSRQSYFALFDSTSHLPYGSRIESSKVQEGVKSLRGTVQWNEVHYLECFQFSFIQIVVNSSGEWCSDFVASIPVAQLLQTDKVLLWGVFELKDKSCTLYLSTSQVLDGVEEQDHDTYIRSRTRAQNSYLHAGSKIAHSAPAARITDTLHTILCQLSSLMEAVDLLKVGNDDIFWTQRRAYATYELSLDSDSESSHPRANVLINSMMSTMQTVLSTIFTHKQRVAEYAADMMDTLHWATEIMYDFICVGKSNWEDKNPEIELPRLIWLILTPDPLSGVRSASASSNHRAVSSTIAKDMLLCALDALAQSSDACSPLKSVAGGLMFFATWADLVSSNKEEIRETCERINSLVTYFKLVITDDAPLTAAHQNTINALAKDIASLNSAVEEIVAERKSRLKRYVSAKQHRKKLEGIARKLDEARGNYMVAVVTLHTSTTADVLAHVQAHSVIMGASPMYAPGTRRADAFTFPFSPAHIEGA